MKPKTRVERFISGLAAGLFIAGILAVATPAGAQYFGRNKVQYAKFDFKVMKTEHFDIYFYPREQKAVEIAARLAERWYKRLSRVFNFDLKTRQPLILYGSHPEFEQTTVINEIMGEGTGGVTEMFKRRIILPFGATLAETDHVIGHELVHAFQFDITKEMSPNKQLTESAALRLPLWFIEGMAEYLSIGPVDANTAMWMRDAIRQKKMPTVKKMESTRYFPYRYGQALWAYIGGRWGDLMVTRLLKEAGRMGDYEKVMERALGLTLDQLSKDWHASLEKDYLALVPASKEAADYGPSVAKGSEDVRYNVSPSVSPDGRQFVFLSSKALFSIELYLADAQTGKTTRRITRTAVDPHIQSLGFINSSGSWNRAGTEFAFGAVTGGQPILAMVNPASRKIDREIVFPQLGEILNPTWSPDGQSIAFSALTGGTSDIYICDVKTAKLRQMTDDFFGDIHPSWSPDGKTIAFVTDRFSTHLPTLSPGYLQLALLDPASGEIKALETFPYAKSINPQWSGDSKRLYFLSDRDGIDNIYCYNLESGQTTRVTNLYTGVSGITALSPAMSVATAANKLVYSVYEQGHYSIYAIDSPELLAGQALTSAEGKPSPAMLPPADRKASEVLGLLKNPLFGLPDTTTYGAAPYKPKLLLDYVAPPSVAIGADRYGSYVGGGLAFYLSDMLGYHNLALMGQVSNQLIDTAVLAGYQNNRSRWNWGAVVERIPYIYGYYGLSMEMIMGEPAYVYSQYLFRQINYLAGVFASYPFNPVKRLELGVGFQYIDFNYEIRQQAYSMYDGLLLADLRLPQDAPKGMAFGYATAAFVYDSSIFGATSPIIGQSYRLEVQPSIGSISYVTLLGDYRRYLMPVKPFTLAFRVLHYGRYGKGSQDERLWPLYIGYETMVRGYDYYSFDLGAEFDWDRLFGSRIAIANLELRFPLLGLFGLGRGFYGAWPLEFLAFYDIGYAWDSTSHPAFVGGTSKAHKPIRSAGVGLRTNLFGYIILGIDYVVPFDRTDSKGVWQLTISPGF